MRGSIAATGTCNKRLPPPRGMYQSSIVTGTHRKTLCLNAACNGDFPVAGICRNSLHLHLSSSSAVTKTGRKGLLARSMEWVSSQAQGLVRRACTFTQHAAGFCAFTGTAAAVGYARPVRLCAGTSAPRLHTIFTLIFMLHDCHVIEKACRVLTPPWSHSSKRALRRCAQPDKKEEGA